MTGRVYVWVAAAIAGIAAALLVSSAAGAAGCIVLCPTTTTTTTTPVPSSPPVVSGVSAAAASPTSITVHFTVDPGLDKETTSPETEITVFAQVGTESVSNPPSAPAQTVPSDGSAPAPHQATITGLQPGTRYTVYVVAGNYEGRSQVTASPVALGALPAVPVTLSASSSHTTIGTALRFTAVVHGANPYRESAQLQARPAAGGRFTRIATGTAGNPKSSFDGAYNRNADFRVVISGKVGAAQVRAPSTSNLVHVIVNPTGHVYSARPVDTSPEVDVTSEFSVHPVKGSFVGEPVYFYRAPSRSGPYTRFAIVRVHAHGFPRGVIGARAAVSSPGAISLYACVRHQLLPDMGVPFTFARCGGATLG